MKTLDECRVEIDEIDKQMIELFERRMNVVKDVVKYKLENNMQIFQPDREKIVLDKNVNRISNEALKPYAHSFILEMMTVSKSYQSDFLPTVKMYYPSTFKENPMVGYQGVPGAFSQSAIYKMFGEDTQNIGYEEFEDVFVALKEGKIDYGVLPIENSLTGSINDNYDLIRKYGFYIVGEVAIGVNQCLMVKPGMKLQDIKQVYSHPQGLGQTSDFFLKHRNIEPMPYKDTALAAKYVSESNFDYKGAIASPLAAKLYGLEIIGHSIQNDPSNMTRFMVISRELICKEDADKTSILFTLNHRVGALYEILDIIQQNDINLVRIESRPIKGERFKYYFYLDFEGSIQDEIIVKALQKIKANTLKFKVLGSYKKAEIE